MKNLNKNNLKTASGAGLIDLWKQGYMMKVESDRLTNEHRLANPPSLSVSAGTRETLVNTGAAVVSGCFTGAGGAVVAAPFLPAPVTAATGCVAGGTLAGIGYTSHGLVKKMFESKPK